MEQQDNKPNQATPDPTPTKSGSSPLAIRNLLPGMVIGILIGIAGFLVYQRHLPQVTRTLYTVTLTSFGVLVLSFVLLYAFKKQITAFIFGSATANAEEVIEDAQRVTDALTDRFADTLLRDVAPDVRQRVRHVLPRLANWFIWSRFRNWWWQWVLGIFVSLGGLTGTLLLMNQNELLEAQNIKIDSQTNLMRKQTELAQQQMSLDEASRRSALVVLMSNIMDKVDREIESQQKGLSFKQKEKRKYQLSQSLIGQIAALSHSFKPYRYLQGDTLIERPLSPERGQLLITLTLLPLDTATLHKIYYSATFESADLQGAELQNADLRGVKLENADISNANLRGVNLFNANLINSDMTGTFLSYSDLRKAKFTFAKMLGVNLRGANLQESILAVANLIGAKFGRADLSGANLSGADFLQAEWAEKNIIEANLNNVDFTGANFKRSKLYVVQLSKSRSLYECENLHDSLKLLLQQSHPQLFQAPK